MSKKQAIARSLIAVVLALVALAWTRVEPSERIVAQEPSVPPIASTTTNAFVVRAVDGDTLEVRRDGETDPIKVRLLGVDTPESVDPRRPVECMGKEASAFTASLTNGRRVQLEADPEADEVDKYGRLLRNVILDDGRDLNALLVREGYANAYLSFPLNSARKVELSHLEQEAKAGERGLWNPEFCGN